MGDTYFILTNMQKVTYLTFNLPQSNSNDSNKLHVHRNLDFHVLNYL